MADGRDGRLEGTPHTFRRLPYEAEAEAKFEEEDDKEGE